MALAERAELVARLSLQDDFSRKAKGVSGAVQRMGVDFQKVGQHARRGLANATQNLTRLGVVAGGFVALNVKQGISSLAELEDAITSVDGAIAQVGKGWSTNGAQIAQWANEIEAATEAAFDDKDITAATDNLIRYGSVAEENLRPAMEVMTDLAAKTGDVESASSLLGKALADPEKAAGKLARMGIVLTKQQQKQIEALVEGGDAAKAQGLLLDILADKTKGAAAASAGPYRDALNKMKDAAEDAQRALGEAFLPVISRVADTLQKELAKPETIRQLREFGTNLAGAFDKALDAAGKIPWGTIGDSLKLAGTGAKAVFDAFTSLPPWVQTAVLTGWGLNKLSGGMLGSIVGELGKGLIRGVLGINAGVVNINAGTVNGGGVGAGGGGLGIVGGALAAGGVGAAAAGAVLDVQTLAQGFSKGYDASQRGDVQGILSAQKDTYNQLILLPPGLRELMGAVTTWGQAEVNKLGGTVKVQPQGLSPDERGELNKTRGVMSTLDRRMEANRIATVNSKTAIVSGLAATRAAIRNNRPIVNVRIPLAVYTTNNITRRVYSVGSSVNNPSGPQEF